MVCEPWVWVAQCSQAGLQRWSVHSCFVCEWCPSMLHAIHICWGHMRLRHAAALHAAGLHCSSDYLTSCLSRPHAPGTLQVGLIIPPCHKPPPHTGTLQVGLIIPPLVYAKAQTNGGSATFNTLLGCISLVGGFLLVSSTYYTLRSMAS